MDRYRHNCNQILWVAWKWNGLEYYPVVSCRRFGRDDEVESCPGCGEGLLPRLDIEEGNLKAEAVP